MWKLQNSDDVPALTGHSSEGRVSNLRCCFFVCSLIALAVPAATIANGAMLSGSRQSADNFNSSADIGGSAPGGGGESSGAIFFPAGSLAFSFPDDESYSNDGASAHTDSTTSSTAIGPQSLTIASSANSTTSGANPPITNAIANTQLAFEAIVTVDQVTPFTLSGSSTITGTGGPGTDAYLEFTEITAGGPDPFTGYSSPTTTSGPFFTSGILDPGQQYELYVQCGAEAFDTGSGTSVPSASYAFQATLVIPEPGSSVLVAIAGLLMPRRRLR